MTESENKNPASVDALARLGDYHTKTPTVTLEMEVFHHGQPGQSPLYQARVAFTPKGRENEHVSVQYCGNDHRDLFTRMISQAGNIESVLGAPVLGADVARGLYNLENQTKGPFGANAKSYLTSKLVETDSTPAAAQESSQAEVPDPNATAPEAPTKG